MWRPETANIWLIPSVLNLSLSTWSIKDLSARAIDEIRFPFLSSKFSK